MDSSMVGRLMDRLMDGYMDGCIDLSMDCEIWLDWRIDRWTDHRRQINLCINQVG